MGTSFVELFLGLVAIAIVLWLTKILVQNAVDWSEEALESFRKAVVVSRLKKMLRHKSRPETEEIALALVLADYHWPARRSEEDESLAKARVRHSANLKTVSDQGLTDLIERQFRDKHSIFLNIAIETLGETRRVKGR